MLINSGLVDVDVVDQAPARALLFDVGSLVRLSQARTIENARHASATGHLHVDSLPWAPMVNVEVGEIQRGLRVSQRPGAK